MGRRTDAADRGDPAADQHAAQRPARRHHARPHGPERQRLLFRRRRLARRGPPHQRRLPLPGALALQRHLDAPHRPRNQRGDRGRRRRPQRLHHPRTDLLLEQHALRARRDGRRGAGRHDPALPARRRGDRPRAHRRAAGDPPRPRRSRVPRLGADGARRLRRPADRLARHRLDRDRRGADPRRLRLPRRSLLQRGELRALRRRRRDARVGRRNRRALLRRPPLRNPRRAPAGGARPARGADHHRGARDRADQPPARRAGTPSPRPGAVCSGAAAHRAGTRHVLAALPGSARAARARLLGVLGGRAAPGHRLVRRQRGRLAGPAGGGAAGDRSRSCSAPPRSP